MTNTKKTIIFIGLSLSLVENMSREMKKGQKKKNVKWCKSMLIKF